MGAKTDERVKQVQEELDQAKRDVGILIDEEGALNIELRLKQGEIRVAKERVKTRGEILDDLPEMGASGG